ncbi:MAG: hypothetical protein IJ343_11690 [Clostridia bacterium]|nr:hypothetical protein [Clostridia bacterium]
MKLQNIIGYLKRDGWLIAAICLCAAMCLLLGGAGEESPSQESQISRVLSAMSGAGEVDVAVYSQDAIPCGALVIADGASDMTVRLRLTSAVAALLGLAPERIAVYPRNGGAEP